MPEIRECGSGEACSIGRRRPRLHTHPGDRPTARGRTQGFAAEFAIRGARGRPASSAWRRMAIAPEADAAGALGAAATAELAGMSAVAQMTRPKRAALWKLPCPK